MASKVDQLKELYSQLQAAASTLPLAQTANDIVPGEGNPEAEIMFIGEAPGYFESVEHRPFVGKSGQLFRKTLVEVGIPEADVYISNIVKARPPDNRDPLPAEIAAYKPYLNQEIEIIQPKVVVTLGRYSMGKFLPDVKVSQVHGRLHKVKWNGQPLFILPMYHPAAALRAPQVKTSFVADFQKLPKLLEWIQDQNETAAFAEDLKEALL
jgi:uracil-DNA glycosylase family 4